MALRLLALDPAARAERKRRRARRSLAYRSLATLGLAYLTSRVGVDPGVELGEVFWAAASVVTGVGAVSAGRLIWRLERAPRPVRVPALPALPPPGSCARPALTRLNARESVLGELLTALGSAAGDGWADAAGAAQTLRQLAARIVLLESARQGVPAEAAPGLDAALAVLRQRLDEGVSGYERLVCSASDAVAAHAGGIDHDSVSVRRLEEAADSLAGLARGLRETARLSDGSGRAQLSGWQRGHQ